MQGSAAKVKDKQALSEKKMTNLQKAGVKSGEAALHQVNMAKNQVGSIKGET